MVKSKFTALLGILLVSLLIFSSINEANTKGQQGKKQNIQSKGQNKRQNIIKCCGKKSCSNVGLKKNSSLSPGQHQKADLSNKKTQGTQFTKSIESLPPVSENLKKNVDKNHKRKKDQMKFRSNKVASSKEPTDQVLEIQRGMEVPRNAPASSTEVLIGHDDDNRENNAQQTTELIGTMQQSRNQPLQTTTINANARDSLENGAAAEKNLQLLSETNKGHQQSVAGSGNDVILSSDLKLSSLPTSTSRFQTINKNEAMESDNSGVITNSPQLNAFDNSKIVSNYSTSKIASNYTTSKISSNYSTSKIASNYSTSKNESANKPATGENITENGALIKSMANNTSADSNSGGTLDLNKDESASNSSNSDSTSDTASKSDADFQSGNDTNGSSTDDESEDAEAIKNSESLNNVGDAPTTEYKFEDEVPDYDGVDANGKPKTTPLPIICSQVDSASRELKQREEKYKNDREKAAEKNLTLPTTKAPEFKGTVYPVCGREYFLGYERKTVSGASMTCMQRNQTIFSFDSYEELDCLAKNLYPKILRQGGRFWSSVSNGGPEKTEYKQCGVENNNFLSSFLGEDSNWYERNALFPKFQTCLAYKLNSSAWDNTTGLFHTSCSNSLVYMCEPKCQKSTCPSTCASNKTLFEADGKLKKPELYGVWMEKCGRKYLFGNALRTWEQNLETCCMLGMDPIYFESLEDQTCVINFTSTDWKFNMNYWTAGSARGCGGQWRWCGPTESQLKSDLLWEPGQPDNDKGNETCMHMRIYNDKLGARLTDRNCTDKYVFACQGTPNIGKMCVDGRPACPTKKCTKNKALFYYGPLTNFESYGTWVDSCKRTYLFSKEKLTWEAAYDKCCTIGMKLVTVLNGAKHKCLIKAIIAQNKTMGKYWTSGTDRNCSGKHFWCAENLFFKQKDVNWAKDQPKNSDGDCVFITGTTNANTSTYAKEKCTKELQYICETPQQGTEAQNMVNECTAQEDASLDEVEDLGFQEYNASKSEKNTKCFLKCLAESKKVMGSGGGLDPVASIKMIEMTTKDNPQQMQSGFSAYDDCKPNRKNTKYGKCSDHKLINQFLSADGDDECSKSSDLFICAMLKASNVLNTMIGTVRYDTRVYMPPVPCKKIPRSCYSSSLPCTLNNALKNELSSTNMTSVGKLYIIPGGLRIFAATPKWSYYLYNHTYAYKYCCSLGMQLYRPTNYTELQSVANTLRLTSGTATAVIGFTKEYNTTHELWCDTNTAVHKSSVLPNILYPGYICQSTLVIASLNTPSYSYIRIRDLPYTFNTFLCQ